MELLIDILEKTIAYFSKAGLENPRVDAEWILAETLGLKKLEMYLQFERPITDGELGILRDRVRRRARREPLQHVLGTADFCGLSLLCDSRALVPRPETEELVELALAKIQAEDSGTYLDLGTGSGAIALALLQARPKIRLIGVDVSADALALAAENADRLKLKERFELRQGNWFEGLRGTFDGLISNPPYLTEAEWEEAEPEVRVHDPKSALVAEDEGLADLRLIFEGARNHLKTDGWILVETGIGQHEDLLSMAGSLGWSQASSHRDLSGRSRFLQART